MKKTPVFSRFFAICKAVLFTVFLMCFSLKAFSANCQSGYIAQTNVFADQQNCEYGYVATSNGSVSDTSDNTWISSFSSFRVKGKAYCSTTAPGANAEGAICSEIPRRPMANTINTNNSGSYCWCQATEYQAFSTVSHTWNAPFQKIYAKYVYLKDMGDSCQNSCATYCSYMNRNLILDGSSNVMSVNLRASIYDSLLECIPIENKITYISDGDIIDYQYYTGNSVTLKDAITKNYYLFQGWCATETCDNPMSANSVQTGWTGAKTLYAKWERSGCETGLRTENIGGTITCTNECADGYETQFDPFHAQYSSAPNEGTYCARKGNGSETINGTGWAASFSSYGYMVKGESYCSPTTPLTQSGPQDELCEVYLRPMLETIDTQSSGTNCWCKATEYDELGYDYSHSSYLTSNATPLDTNYVYTTNLGNRCAAECPSFCRTMVGQGVYHGITSVQLRVSIYRSLKKCKPLSYTLTLKDGDKTLDTIEYSAFNAVNLSAPSDIPAGYEFAGWCENLSDCDDPMIGEQTGLFGNKTLYAKWVAIPSQITYEVSEGFLMPSSAPTVYTVSQPVTLVSETESDDLTYYDGPDFDTANQVTTLPDDTHTTTPTTLYVAHTPKSQPAQQFNGCETGYELKESGSAVLDPAISSIYIAYRSSNGERSQYTWTNSSAQDWIPEIKADYASKGRWGFLFPGPNASSRYLVYGTSSCNTQDGSTPPGFALYSEAQYDTMAQTDTTGGKCWCKLSKFIYNDTTSSGSWENPLTTPWVYLKSYNNTDGCRTRCTEDCVGKIQSDPFFRAQVYGEYSLCEIEHYTITLVKNGGEWTEGTTPPDTYTIRQSVEIPNTISKEYFTFGGWCDAGYTNCSNARTISVGSYGDKTFYAKWTATQFNLNYHWPQTGQNDPTDTTIWWSNERPGGTHPNTYTVEDTIYVSYPKREGYNFIGWCIGNNNCTDDEARANKDYTIVGANTHESLDLYPRWEEKTFGIIYKKMDGTVINGLTPATYTYTQDGTLVSLPAGSDVEALNPNYAFVAWHNAQNTLSTSVVSNINPGIVGPQTFYAELQGAQFDVTYYEGSTQITSFAQQYYKYNYGTGLTLPNPTRCTNQHYDFRGWYNNVDLTGNAITAISTTDSGNKEFWAKCDLHEYSIRYFLNYPKTTPPYFARTYTINDDNIDVIEVNSTDIPEHFEFSGWYDCTNAAPASDAQPITQIITANGGDWDLCAKWTRISCEDNNYLNQTTNACVSCPTTYPYADGQTATSASDCYALCPVNPSCPENSTCNYDEHVDTTTEYTVSGNVYYHNYYSTGLTPCGIEYDCYENYTDSGTACTPDSFPIKYHDGATELTNTQVAGFGLTRTYLYHTETSIVSGTISKPHFDFGGWYDNAGLSGNAVTSISVADADGTTKHFYAKWNNAQHYIQFLHGTAGTRTDGFSGTMPNQPVQFNEENITLNSNMFGISGYHFRNWSCVATYDDNHTTTTEYSDGDTVAKYEYVSLVCTAQWDANPYTLTYNCGEGELSTGQSPTAYVYYDGAYILDESICATRPGHTISDWACTNGLDITNPKWNITNDSTCTANWGGKTYSIQYLESDGSTISGITPTNYTVGTATTVPTSNNPSKTHFNFVGWCDDTSLTVNCALHRTISATSTANPVRFYAKWEPTACPGGQYLNVSTHECLSCAPGLTSDAWTATSADDCYDSCDTANGYYFSNGICTNTYTVTYNCGNGSGNKPANGTATYNVSFMPAANSCTPPEGKEFNGWLVSGTANTIKPELVAFTWLYKQNKTFTAQWKDAEFVCESGKYFHIDDDAMCLSLTPPANRPYLVLGRENQKRYLHMSEQSELPINDHSTKKFKIKRNDHIYNVHDASVGNGG